MSVSATSPAVADPAIGEFLNRSGLVKPGEGVQLVPLTGGVASDIFRVDVGERASVIKKALARLRVAQEWNAPVSRNASEVGWFIEARRAVPQAVPDILAHDPALGLFAMTYLDPAHHSIWKNELRDGRVSAGFAAAVGQAVVAIHEATARSADVASRFSNDETFHAIRLEPYLDATARRHGDLAEELARMLARDEPTSDAAASAAECGIRKNLRLGTAGGGATWLPKEDDAMIWAAERSRYLTYICEEWSAVTGQPPAETLGLGWLEVLHPDDRAIMRDAFLEAFEHRCTLTLRYRLQRRTGEYVWAISAAAPSFDPATADFIGFLGIVSRSESEQDQIVSAELRHFRAVQPIGEFAPISKLDLLADHLLMARSSAVDAAKWLLPKIDDTLFDVGRELARQEAAIDTSNILH